MSTASAKPGAFQMLLWKEWRQQRWTLFGMSALALVLFVLGGTLLRRWSFEMSGAAYVFALAGIPLVLSARAYAGEDEDGTAVFLRELPFRPLQVFAAKFVVVVLASWAAGSVLLLLARLWPGYPDNALGVIPWLTRTLPERGPVAAYGGIWLLAPVAASFASLLASLGLRSLTTALLSSVGLCLSVCCAAVSVLYLDLLGARGFVWLLGAASVPAAGALVTSLLSARRHPRTWVQCVRGGGGCAAVLVLFLLPGALSELYLVALARPEAYVRLSWWRACLGEVIAVAPPSEHPTAVLLDCRLRREPSAAALALLEPAPGRAAWVDTRALAPAHAGVGRWSPDGARLAWYGTGRTGLAAIPWTTKALWLSVRSIALYGSGRIGLAAIPWITKAPRLCVHDIASERTLHVPSRVGFYGLLPGPWWHPATSPWYDNTWLAGDTLVPSVGVGFINTVDGSTHILPLPLAAPTVPWSGWIGTVVLPGNAVFTAVRHPATKAAGEELVIATCTPTAAEVTTLRVNKPPPSPAWLWAVSPDAKWALFAPEWQRAYAPGGPLDLVSLATGATRRIVPPPQLEERPAAAGRSNDIGAVGFAPDGARLILSAYDALALYDPDRDTWEVCAPPTPDRPEASRGAWRSSPGRSRMVQEYYPFRQDRPSMARIFDLRSREWTTLPLDTCRAGTVQWFGNEHLLMQNDEGLWKLGLDGSRELLWPRE
jgi:hypothetical protein